MSNSPTQPAANPLDDLLDGIEPDFEAILEADIATAQAAPKRGRGRPKGTRNPPGDKVRRGNLAKISKREQDRIARANKQLKRSLKPQKQRIGSVTAEFLLTGEGMPWDDLPDSSDFTEDVRWVANSYKLVVTEKPGQLSEINWKKASRPPSKLAVSLMEVAAANRQKFFFDIALKVLLDEKTGEDSAEVKQEKIDIAEIDKQLDKLLKAQA